MGVAFLVTTLIVVVSPGIGVLYTVAAGLSHGARAGIVAAFGCTLGILPHLAAALLGLAAVFHTSAVAFQTLKYLGVAYLLVLAWHTLKEKGTLTPSEGPVGRTPRQVVVSAVLVNILNPKLSLFFFAFLPQFVSADDPHRLVHMLQLSSVFIALTFIVFAGYALAAAWMRRHVLSKPRVLAWMRRTFAGAFLALGAKLALAGR
jgi:threonine/homoserine/homoserine lactone efflux protein